ncbi:unnamed protein product [Chilo suppressalis]|uniref:Tc1-like transposase DDE domain-containing protein n=1 Tax=Chilo suppressalis TaxID=168631 RepID=A0ABN8B1L9_CHISP|nr:unnamed protein product [Chilo suppressalis]
MSNKRPNTGLRGFLLHHDNAPAHSAIKTKDALDSTPVREFRDTLLTVLISLRVISFYSLK